MGNSKRLALGFLLGALLVGGVLGFTTARVFAARGYPWSDTSYRRAIAEYVGLTPEQRVKLDDILDRRHRDMSAVLAPVRPQLDSIRERARDEMRRMMTAEQRAAFERLLAEQQSGKERSR